MLRITLAKRDKNLLEKFVEDINTSCRVIDDKTRNTSSVKICSSKIFDDLSSHGICKWRSKSSNIPIGIPRKYINDFIRGLFDGDGCITKHCGKNPFSVVSIANSKSMCYWVSNEVGKIVNYTKSYVYLDKNKKTCKTYYKWSTGKKDYVKLFANWIYDGATRFLDRKYRRFVEYGLIDDSLANNSEIDMDETKYIDSSQMK